MSILQALSGRAACAAVALVALVAFGAPGGNAAAQSSGASGVAASFLGVGPAGFGDGTRVRERQTGLRVWSPAYVFDGIEFQAGANYAYTRYSFEGLPTRHRDLHHLHLPLRWSAPDDRWLAVVTPVIATSSNVFKDFLNRGSRDDLDLHLRFQLQHLRDTNAGWRVALVRDTAFGSPRFYPAAALLWKGRRVQAELGVPSSRVAWQAGEHLILGAAVFPTGGSWHVISDERGGAQFDYRARAWRGALTAQWQPVRRWHVGAQAGIEFRRHYEFEDDTGRALDRDAGSAGYFRIELRYLFRG